MTTVVGASGAIGSIPASQAYYWSRRWQDEELESRRELALGRGVRFGSVDDAIAWLASDDEDA